MTKPRGLTPGCRSFQSRGGERVTMASTERETLGLVSSHWSDLLIFQRVLEPSFQGFQASVRRVGGEMGKAGSSCYSPLHKDSHFSGAPCLQYRLHTCRVLIIQESLRCPRKQVTLTYCLEICYYVIKFF